MSGFLIKFSVLFIVYLSLTSLVKTQTTTPPPTQTADQLVAQANSYIRAKQFDKAVELYKQAIKLNPDLAAAYSGLGGVYINMARLSDAVEQLKIATRLDPENSLIHLNLGIAYYNMRLPDQAVSELNLAKQISPNDSRIYNEIGNVLNNSFGRTQDALEMYQQAQKLNPKIAGYYHNIGFMYMRLGKFAEAIEPLEQALKLEPKYRNARYFLSDAYNKVGRYNDAVQSWTEFLAIVPNGPEALTKRAWNYLYVGGYGKEAAADARQFLNTNGWNSDTSAFMAVIANIGYRQAGMSKEAEAVIKEAARECKPDTWTYNLVLYFKGELNSGQLMQKAIDNDRKTEAHTYLGMDALLRENREEAKTHFLWVKEYGNRRFFEYPLAIEELKRFAN